MGEIGAKQLLPEGMHFYKTSAKSNKNIDYVFQEIVLHTLAKKKVFL